VAHFSDIDMQGHYSGVDVKWNPTNSYVEAVRNKTKILRKLFAAAPPGTTLVIVSDHGHVDRGGHGGIDAVLRDAPLIIYHKGSGLGLKLPPVAPLPPYLPQFKRAASVNGPIYDSTDVAPTICALLGLPVPRTGQGRLIEEALMLLPPASWSLHLSDLLYQNTAAFTQWKAAVEADMNVPALPTNVSSGSSAAASAAAIDKMNADYWASRQRIMAIAVQKNQLLNLLVADVVMAVIMMQALHRYTMADPWNAFRVLFKWVPCFGFHLSDHQQLVGAVNLRAITISVGLTVVYFIVTVGTLLAITFGLGYDAWDSTLIHSPNAFVRYLGVSLGPAFFYSMVHQRMIEIITIDPTSMFVKVCPARCCSLSFAARRKLPSIRASSCTPLYSSASKRASSYACASSVPLPSPPPPFFYSPQSSSVSSRYLKRRPRAPALQHPARQRDPYQHEPPPSRLQLHLFHPRHLYLLRPAELVRRYQRAPDNLIYRRLFCCSYTFVLPQLLRLPFVDEL
jgi:hypothetical protein